MPCRAARMETAEYYRDPISDESLQGTNRFPELAAVTKDHSRGASLSSPPGHQIIFPPPNKSGVIIIPLKSTQSMKAHEWVMLIVPPLIFALNLVVLYRWIRGRHLKQPVQRFRVGHGGRSHHSEEGQRDRHNDANPPAWRPDVARSFDGFEPQDDVIEIECLSIQRPSVDITLPEGVKTSID